MTVRERMLTIRLMERVKRDPEYAKRLGIVVICKEEEAMRRKRLKF